MKAGNAKRIWATVIVVIFISSYLIIGYFYSKKTSLIIYNKFNSANIHGKLVYVGDEQKACAIQVSENPNIYIFHPYTDKLLNDGNIFDSFAQPGDEVVKPPNSDTLFLIKNKKVYKYTFFKAVSN